MDINQIIEGCLAKDNRAWSIFVERFTGLIFYSVKTRLRVQNFRFSKEDVEDIVQSIFLEIWKRELLAQVRDRKKINAWLSIISQNRAIDFVRKRRERLMDEGEMRSFEKLVSVEVDPAEDAEDTERWEALQDAIGMLSDREKLTIELFIIYEKSYKEIADFMKVSINTVSTIIHRSKEKIRKFLKEKGLEERLI